MEKYRLIILILSSITLNLHAGTSNTESYFLIERIEKDAYAIPLIKSENNPEIASKINQVIQMSLVYNLYDIVGKEKLFDKMINEDGYSGTTSLDYNILLNSASVLSIEFNDETLTAYPDYHTSYLNFNSTTGDIIDLNELLSNDGISHLNDLASGIYNQKVKSLYNESIYDYSTDESQKKDFVESIFDLTKCNATNKIWKFGITSNTLIVEKDRCFPHAMQAFDIGWNCQIKIDDLYKSDFSTYGHNLLKEMVSDNSMHYIDKVNNMTLHGKIDNKYPFCMYLRLNSDNSIGGLYWYSKKGVLIDFSGTKTSNNKIELTEKGGKFKLDLQENGSISGDWINSGGKLFSIKFE
ncbi:MAG TPA: hypothetical protein VLZ83_16060 [Edaphocola sp.]|nr:hypothetical protein [Edaphocola sp.]